MPEIILTTVIDAPVERCFDLARSIEFHEFTTSRTNEKAIAGRTTGLIGNNEWVTWKAKHFGITQTLTSKITRCDRPYVFEDVMLKGAFRSIRHVHTFEFRNGQTTMKDVFEFESPLGMLGKIFNKVLLTNYLRGFLLERNGHLKRAAETDEWKKFLEF